MICFLVRHGQDDNTVRGGWSKSPLTYIGIEQINKLANELKLSKMKYNISSLYSSDLPRALQTAEIIAQKMNLPIKITPLFRETNNGLLSGIKNELANEKYPGLFWNTLEWNESYPNGESPCDFYERITNAWNEFSQMIVSGSRNTMLVTHGGVINIILSLIENKQWSNKELQEKIPNAAIIAIEFNDNKWSRLPT